MAGLPERVFYSLSDIQTAWQISSSDIRQWLMHGQIRANVWLPLMSVYEIKEQAEGNRIILTKELRHWEGYTPLYPHTTSFYCLPHLPVEVRVQQAVKKEQQTTHCYLLHAA